MTRIVVTSASGSNGDGYGTLVCFSADGQLAGPFSDDQRIKDPRGLSLSQAGDLVYVTSGDDRVLALDMDGTAVLDSGRTEGLDPGGGTLAPDGRYCVTLRRRGTILALPPDLETEGELLLPDGAVPFPRGFGFGSGGEMYLSSGIGPTGEGDNTITVFDRGGRLRTRRLVNDPDLSLDPPREFGRSLSGRWPGKVILGPIAGVVFPAAHCRAACPVSLAGVRAGGARVGCGCGCGDRVGAGQAAGAGGPQPASNRLVHSCSRCQPSGRCMVIWPRPCRAVRAATLMRSRRTVAPRALA